MGERPPVPTGRTGAPRAERRFAAASTVAAPLPTGTRLSVWIVASTVGILLVWGVAGLLEPLTRRPLEVLLLPFQTQHTAFDIVSGVLLATWLSTWFTTRRGGLFWTLLAAVAWALWAALMWLPVGLSGLAGLGA